MHCRESVNLIRTVMSDWDWSESGEEIMISDMLMY